MKKVALTLVNKFLNPGGGGNILKGFFKKGHFRPLFLYFRLFNTVDSKQVNVPYKSLPMTGFEPRTSCVGSDHSTN